MQVGSTLLVILKEQASFAWDMVANFLVSGYDPNGLEARVYRPYNGHIPGVAVLLIQLLHSSI